MSTTNVAERAKVLVAKMKSLDAALRMEGIEELRLMSKEKTALATLYETPGVVDVLLACARNGENNMVVTLGLKTLANLAATDVANKVHLFNWNGIVETMLQAAQAGATDDIKESGLWGLLNLANNCPENHVRLFRWQGVVDTFVQAARSGNTAGIKKRGFQGLWSLSDNRSNAEELVTRWKIHEWLKDSDTTFDLEVAIIHLNLAVSPRAREILIHDNTTFNFLLALINRSTDEKSVFFCKLTRSILKGSDSQFLMLDDNDLKVLLNVLEGALKGDFVLKNKWPLLQPLVALRFLTTLYRNRQSLGNAWLPMLNQSISKSLKDDDGYAAEMALSCLVQYALDSKFAKFVKDDEIYLATAKIIIESKAGEASWSGAVRYASNLLFTPISKDSRVIKGQVMISYAWGPPPHENKDLAAEIEDILYSYNFSVWRDESKMKADIFNAMADAVETSEIMIVLVNKNYMESVNCKRELTYALNSSKRKIKIIPLLVEAGYNHVDDEWLGIAIGSLLFYDITLPVTRTERIRGMIERELLPSTSNWASDKRQRLTESASSILKGPEPELASSSSTSSSPRWPNSIKEVRTWAYGSGIPEDVVQALISGGYESRELLEGLSKESSPDMKQLLGIDKPAKVTTLRQALLKLFQA